MSTQVTTAFVNQFSINVQLLSQQIGSKLRSSVSEEMVTGEKAYFDQIGSGVAQLRTSRHADTPLMETPHARRQVAIDTYEYADLVDDAYKVRMLIDPTSTYARAAAAAIGRAMDDAIISAATGTANTGVSGGTSTSMLAANQIAHGSAGLTVAKLVQAKKILDNSDVDPSIQRYIVCGPEQMEDLLNNSTVTSSDYNSIKALVQGDIDTFVGFKFITSTRLSVSSSVRTCFAWAMDGIKLAVGKDVMARIEDRADKSYSTQVFYCASFGSTRMEEEKVVQIDCSE